MKWLTILAVLVLMGCGDNGDDAAGEQRTGDAYGYVLFGTSNVKWASLGQIGIETPFELGTIYPLTEGKNKRITWMSCFGDNCTVHNDLLVIEGGTLGFDRLYEFKFFETTLRITEFLIPIGEL